MLFRGSVIFNTIATIGAVQLHQVVEFTTPDETHGISSTHESVLLEIEQATSQCTGDCKSTALNLHNEKRACHSANALTWNQMVADSAQAWVNQMVSANQMSHAQSNSPHYSYSVPAGENLAAGTQGWMTMTKAITMWYDEVDDCVSLPGCTEKTGVVGHFTALVWKGVTQIGCGIGDSAQGTTYIACRYWSGASMSGNTANMQGHYTTNVLAKTSACGGSGDDSGGGTGGGDDSTPPGPGPDDPCAALQDKRTDGACPYWEGQGFMDVGDYPQYEAFLTQECAKTQCEYAAGTSGGSGLLATGRVVEQAVPAFPGKVQLEIAPDGSISK